MAPRQGKSEPTVDSWSEKDQQIQVAEGNGFLYNLQLRAKVEGNPSMVYTILTDPNAVDVFRSIKACTFRKVLEEDKVKRQRKLEVGHKALAKFLFISITFETRLFVWEDDINRKIRFCNAQDGFMKKFEGSWHIQPFTAQSLKAPSEAKQHSHGLRMPNPFGALHSKLGQKESAATLATLEQAVLPKTPSPPGIKGLIRRLCAKQIRDMMEDLRTEVDRREGRGKADKKGKAGKGKAATSAASAAAAASMTLAQPVWDIWEHVTPINITIKL